MAVNISEVRLLAVPLHSDYKNTAYFESLEAQEEYFTGKVKFTTTNVSYIKDNAFVYPEDYDTLGYVNYVMYKNRAYRDKWFYAFITDKERLNDGATRIHIKTDSVQTYLKNYRCGYSFIEREHVNNDTIGIHTVPEGLETGEYTCDGRVTNAKLMSNRAVVVGSTIDLINYTNQPNDWNMTKEFRPVYGDIYNGLFSGLKYYAVTPGFLSKQLANVAYEGQEDAIHSIFVAPLGALDVTPDSSAGGAVEINNSASPKKFVWTGISKPTSLDGYPPKNNKLFTAPYCYLMVDNGGGCAVNYNYEKFSSSDCDFNIYAVVTPGMSVRAVPLNYNGVDENDAEGINLSKYASCSWTTDAYTAWLAKNGVNIGLQNLAGLSAIAGGIAAAPLTGGASLAATGAAIAGGAMTVANSLMSMSQAAQVPPQLHGNTNNGDVATAKGDVTFRAYKMSIKREYAQIIDRYLTRYGYKVNRYGIPHKNHRKYFWYTKTIDAEIVGNIPQEDLLAIKQCYDKGITFWKNPDEIGLINMAEGNPIDIV